MRLFGMMIFLVIFLLPNIGWSSTELFSEALAKPLSERLTVFQGAGPKGKKYLSDVAMNQQTSLVLRWRAVTTLGRLQDEKDRPTLEKMLKAKEWFLRNAALIAIKKSERSWVISWSNQLLRDPALVVRTQAVRNLIELGAAESEPILWREIFAERNFRQKKSLWVRAHMAEALAQFAAMASRSGSAKKIQIQQFAKLLEDDDSRLHAAAVRGLEAVSDTRFSADGEPIESRREKWLSRLRGETI